MKNHYYLIKISILVVLCIVNIVVLLVYEQKSAGSEDESYYPETQVQIDKSRTEAAYLKPDFTDEVTDIRVTVRKRDVDFAKMYEGIVDETEAANTTVYQIYYGYFSNGEWHDIPAENYDLKSLNSHKIDGWQALQNKHIVKIGSKVLLAFPVGNGRASTYDPYAVVTDSLDSNVQSITEYYSASSTGNDFQENCLLLENALAYGTDEYGWFILQFDKWYYIILDYSDLSDGYSVTLNQFWDSSETPASKYTYTYNDILEALNRK